jgi:hypothetical protein
MRDALVGTLLFIQDPKQIHNKKLIQIRSLNKSPPQFNFPRKNLSVRLKLEKNQRELLSSVKIKKKRVLNLIPKEKVRNTR